MVGVLREGDLARVALFGGGGNLNRLLKIQFLRMAHNGDPVMNANGERIGFVTSCAIDGQRFITGQSFVDLAYAKEGTPILIHQGGVMDRPATAAKVVSRFAKL
jgi:hypothetical protein